MQRNHQPALVEEYGFDDIDRCITNPQNVVIINHEQNDFLNRNIDVVNVNYEQAYLRLEDTTPI